MFKELFENKNIAIFDLNSVLSDIHDRWKESIEEVCQNLNIGWINSNKYYIRGRDVTVTWDFILNNPEVNIKKIPMDNLIKDTYAKFINKVKENGINTKEGFEDFVDELKNKKGFKLILKSPYSDTLTALILENAGLEDIFHIIETTPLDKPEKNLYKTIIKTNKIDISSAIAFEESILGSKESTRENITTVVVWDRETPREKYPEVGIMFIEDFSDFVGNMDHTYLETMEMVQEYTKT